MQRGNLAAVLMLGGDAAWAWGTGNVTEEVTEEVTYYLRQLAREFAIRGDEEATEWLAARVNDALARATLVRLPEFKLRPAVTVAQQARRAEFAARLADVSEAGTINEFARWFNLVFQRAS